MGGGIWVREGAEGGWVEWKEGGERGKRWGRGKEGVDMERVVR